MDETSRIFVFGSNMKGRHGKGAALRAAQHYGAIYGRGFGLQGQSYALPTKGYGLEVLPRLVIARHVGYFVKDVQRPNPQLEYNVTQIGCGLAGYKPELIAPMFKPIEEAPNVWFDLQWSQWLPKAKFWKGPL